MLVFGTSQAQNGPPDPANLLPAKFLPKSPTVSTMQRFDAQQLVNLPTGAAQFSVPLATVSCGALQLPVTLGYSFFGLQVSQPYDLVGLGWSLQAGPAITRQVNGLVDDLFINDPARRYHPQAIWAGVGQQTFLERAMLNGVDTGPDMYSFSLPDGSTGRFVFQDTSLVLMPQQPLHIRGIGGRSPLGFAGFQVTTENGIRYQFQKAETTVPNPNNFGAVGPHYTAWQLTQLVSADNADTLRLHYSHSGYEDQPRQSTLTTGSYYTGVYSTSGNAANQGLECGSAADYSFHNARSFVSQVRSQYLDSITARGVSLVFSRSVRHEVQRVRLLATTNGRRETRRVDLYQSVFAGDPLATDYRLRLDSLRESANGRSLPAYRFRYHGGAVPPRISAAKDYWGYYNGATQNGDANTTTIPNLLADPRLAECRLQPAKREPDHAYAQVGALEEVQYPTGGKSQWSYEPGRISCDPDDVPLSYNYEDFGTGYNPANTLVPPNGNRRVTPSSQLVFQVLQPGSIDVTLRRQPHDSTNTTGGTNTYRDFSIWRRLPTGDSLVTNSPNAHEYKILDGQNPERNYQFRLQPGTYVAQVFCEMTEVNTSLALRIPYRDTTLLRLGLPGPGVRVWQTTTTTPGAKPLVRTYRYTANGLSSGHSLLPLNGKGFESNQYSKSFWVCNGGTFLNATDCNMVNTSSENRGLGNDFNKYDFYYESVTEENGLGQGATVHLYTHLAQVFNDVVPAEQRIYRQHPDQPGQLQLAQRTQYRYVTDSTVLFPLMRAYEQALYLSTDCTARPPTYKGVVYDVYAGFAAPALTIQTRYDERGIASTSVTRSTYERQRLVRTATRTSTGWNISRYKRLHEYASSPYTASLRSGSFNPVVEVQTWRRRGSEDSVLVGGHLTFFDTNRRAAAGVWSLRLSQPSASTNAEYRIGGHYVGFKSDTRYQPDDSVRFDTGTGLLQQRLAPHAPPTAYVWGYDRTQVVAQVENATYAQVAAVLSPATLERLLGSAPGTDAQVRQLLEPLRTQLPQARVTIYTYAPLVGLTSQTDPSGRTTFYEYDELGRLLRVRDERGRILTEQEYHYFRP